VDPRAGLGDVEKRKLLTLPRLELDHSVVHPVAVVIPTALFRRAALKESNKR
jgi:hypothetical protein